MLFFGKIILTKTRILVCSFYVLKLRITDVDADYYMRPWKIYKASMDNIKTNAESNEEWIQLSTNNHDLLRRILGFIGMNEKTISKPVKAMWR